MTRLWINEQASDDREEVKAHCERCCDDKDETSKMQEEKIFSRPGLGGRLRSPSTECSQLVRR